MKFNAEGEAAVPLVVGVQESAAGSASLDYIKFQVSDQVGLKCSLTEQPFGLPWLIVYNSLLQKQPKTMKIV